MLVPGANFIHTQIGMFYGYLSQSQTVHIHNMWLCSSPAENEENVIPFAGICPKNDCIHHFVTFTPQVYQLINLGKYINWFHSDLIKLIESYIELNLCVNLRYAFILKLLSLAWFHMFQPDVHHPNNTGG